MRRWLLADLEARIARGEATAEEIRDKLFNNGYIAPRQKLGFMLEHDSVMNNQGCKTRTPKFDDAGQPDDQSYWWTCLEESEEAEGLFQQLVSTKFYGRGGRKALGQLQCSGCGQHCMGIHGGASVGRGHKKAPCGVGDGGVPVHA